MKVATGDVNITDSAIGAVAGPGAHVGTVSVISQLSPFSKNEGKHSREAFVAYTIDK